MYIKQQTIALLAIVAVLTSCVQSPQTSQGAYEKDLLTQGISAYNPPQGDTEDKNSWYQYGPGAIVDGTSGRCIVTADDMLAGVVLSDAKNNRQVFGLTNSKTSFANGLTLTGSFAAASDSLKVAESEIGVSGDTDVEIEFLNPRLSRPRSIGFMEDRLIDKWSQLRPRDRAGLLSGNLVFVNEAIVADGLKYNFTKKRENNAKVEVELTSAQKVSLEGKGIKTHKSGIIVNQPFFVGYRPVNIGRIKTSLPKN